MLYSDFDFKLYEINYLKPNPNKPESKRINHENTKSGKHEIFLSFRVFIISCFRDNEVFHKIQRIHN